MEPALCSGMHWESGKKAFIFGLNKSFLVQVNGKHHKKRYPVSAKFAICKRGIEVLRIELGLTIDIQTLKGNS